MEELTNEEKKVQKGFEKALNQHGYGFQYSVLKFAEELYKKEESAWFFEVSEFPAEVQGYDTRIDFILRRSNRFPPYNQKPFFLIAECKRANPALSNWCFARAPFIRRAGLLNCLVLETGHRSGAGSLVATASVIPHYNDLFFQVALEVRSEKETGDTHTKGRGAIEDATAQVLRGLNGMVDFVKSVPQILGENGPVYFLPVIFTTANIWTSDVVLSSADLEKGEVDLSTTPFVKQPWIFYQYHLSPRLKHSSSPPGKPDSLPDIMESEYIRTVPIVSPQGIETFLRWSASLVLQ